jgi:hypothetical protein
MSRKDGDTKVMWNKGNSDEIEAARATYDSLIAKGFSAFSMDADGARAGTRLREFDPSAERIVMVPRMAGGA